LLRFIERRRDSAARCSHIEFPQQLFGLIFVDVHREPSMPGRAEWNTPRSASQQRFLFFELACVAEIQPTTVAAMKTSRKTFTVAGALLFSVALSIVAGTPEQEKAFIDKYKAAMESKNTATLESFLYTQGSDPAALEFYKMMQSGEAGEKISSIELVNLTPEDVKKATTPMDGPTGKACLNLKPTKKLVIKVEKKDGSGTSSSSSENFVAEKDGKFVIPVPGPCK
jgi:hypothetical protein